MDKIKHILAAYGKWITAALAPLGIWGVFALAAVDAAMMGLPLDLMVSAYIYHDPSRYPLYVLLASAGSALGSLVVYGIGYAGGEVLLRKRVRSDRYEKIHASFDNHEVWAVMFPAMLPPPMPFKAIVLAAGVFEMRFTHFLLAVFAGRCIRFAFEGYIAIKFGPQVVAWTGHVFAHHFQGVLIVIAGGLALWLWLRRKRAAPAGAANRASAKDEPV